MFTVFDKQKVDFKKEPLFFGSSRNIQEYADPKYPIFAKLDDEMESLFWRPQEVSLQKDRIDYKKKMDDGGKFIFVSNLSYQILMDSIQGRSPLLAFLPVITNPELEACIITWGMFEKIHSKSYTHMIRNLFADPAEVTGKILDIPQIIDRAESIGDYYDQFIEVMYNWQVDPKSVSQDELYTKLYMALVSINILEGVRFYVSFACNFAFGENKLMIGTSTIMSLIARDEAKHLALTQHILKLLQNGSEGQYWQQIAEKCKPLVKELFLVAAQQEKDWATYLFEHGSMFGLTEPVLHDYVNYMVNKRMKAIGIDPCMPTTRNPLTWMNNWLNSKSMQVAPQETEIESYVVGAIDADVDDTAFAGFSF